MQWLANPNATTITVVGFAALPTLQNNTSNTLDTAAGGGPFFGFGSGGGDAAGTACGLLGSTTTDPVYANWSADTAFRIKTGPVITSRRDWIGWTNAGASIDATNTPTTYRVAAFRYSTGVPDTNWMAVTCDGAACTYTDTGVAVATSTIVTMRIVFNAATNVKFYLNGTLVATNTANLPTATTALAAVVRGIPLADFTPRLIYWSRIAVVYP